MQPFRKVEETKRVASSTGTFKVIHMVKDRSKQASSTCTCSGNLVAVLFSRMLQATKRKVRLTLMLVLQNVELALRS